MWENSMKRQRYLDTLPMDGKDGEINEDIQDLDDSPLRPQVTTPVQNNIKITKKEEEQPKSTTSNLTQSQTTQPNFIMTQSIYTQQPHTLNQSQNLLNQSQSQQSHSINSSQSQSQSQQPILQLKLKKIQYRRETNSSQSKCLDLETGRFLYIKTIPKAEIKLRRLDKEKIKQILRLQIMFPSNFTKYLSLQKNEVGDLDVVQQLEEGQSLLDLLKQFKKLKNSIRDLTLKMAKCLQIMHNNGVTHGNLKLTNFIVVESGHLKVTDLNFWPTNGKNIQQKLTSEYSAPELFRRKQLLQLTEKCDIWSLGIIILYLYLGFSPWTDQKKQPIPISHIRKLVKMGKLFSLPQSIQGDFRDLLERILERDPSKRIDINSILEHDYLNTTSNSHQETRKTEEQLPECDPQEIYQKLQFSSFSGNSEFSQSSSVMRLNRYSSYSQYSQEKSPIMIPGILTGKVSPFGGGARKNSTQNFKQVIDNLDKDSSANDLLGKFSLNDEKIQASPLRRPSINQRKSEKLLIFQGNQSDNSSSDIMNSEYIVQEFASFHNQKNIQDSDALLSQKSDLKLDKSENIKRLDQYRRDIEKLIEQELQFYDEEHDGQNNQVDSSLYTDSYVDKRLDVVDNSSSSCGVNTQRVNENGSDDSQDYVLDNEEKKPENLHSEIDNYAVIQFNQFQFYQEEKSPSDNESLASIGDP